MNTDDFFKMNIFFVVSTTAVIIFTVLAAIILLYLLRLIKKTHEIANLVKEQLEQVKNTAKFFRTILTKIKGKV